MEHIKKNNMLHRSWIKFIRKRILWGHFFQLDICIYNWIYCLYLVNDAIIVH